MWSRSGRHAAAPDRPIRRVRVSYPRCTNRRSRDRAPAPRSRQHSSPCCSRVSGSGMPVRPRERSPSRPHRSWLIALLAGIGLRMDRIALLGLVFDPNVLNLVFVAQRGRPRLPGRRDRRCLPRRRIHERPGGVGRRPSRPGPAAPQPTLDRGAPGRAAGHGHEPRRRRALRLVRDGPRRSWLRRHLHRRRHRPGLPGRGERDSLTVDRRVRRTHR